jgi:hypothetical protein
MTTVFNPGLPMLTAISDYAALACGQLISQFRQSVSNRSFSATVTPFAMCCQDCEMVLFQLMNGNSIANAIGNQGNGGNTSQLDMIGQMIGCPRNGAPDSTYRLNLYFQILVNTGWGQGDLIIQALENITGGSVQLQELGNASITITITGATNLYSSATIISDGEDPQLQAQIQTVVAAGINVNLVITGQVAPFVWDDAEDGTVLFPFGGGWGEGTDTSGLTILQGTWNEQY